MYVSIGHRCPPTRIIFDADRAIVRRANPLGELTPRHLDLGEEKELPDSSSFSEMEKKRRWRKEFLRHDGGVVSVGVYPSVEERIGRT